MGCERLLVQVESPRLVTSEDLYQSLLNASFRFVSYRPRSKKEIVDFLQKKLKKWKVAGSATVSKVMDRLTELGYIDDKKFTQWWIEQRNTFRPKGIALLVRELYQKGINRDLIEEVLGQSKGSEKEIAKVLVDKKLKLIKHLSKLEIKKKLYGFLGRRGFSSETISRVVDDALSNKV